MRGERTESVFASTTWESAATPGTEPVEVEGFYRYMSDLGLRYGEEFRSIRELSAGQGHSAGRVALSEVIAARAGEYALHPVLLDGALQTFSAGAATIEDRRSRMKLPVRFARILFLRSPGASARVRAGSCSATRNSSKAGSVSTTKPDSRACSSMASARSASRASAVPVRRVARATWFTTWIGSARRRHPASAAPAAAPGTIASRRLDSAGTSHRHPRPSGIAGRDGRGDDLTAAQLAHGLREMGVTAARVSADPCGSPGRCSRF